MDVQVIRRLNNDYRAFIAEAEETSRLNNTVPTVREGMCYQKAAEIAGDLASRLTSYEAEHWIECQRQCTSHMKRIYSYLNPTKAEPVKAEPTALLKPPVHQPDEKEKGVKRSTRQVDEKTISGWFQPTPDYGFDKVAGMDDIKNTLFQCVQEVSVTELNEHLDMPTVNAFFLYGPPGCGKTHIINAFAHELKKYGYRYMKLDSADILNKFSGEADKTVRCAFQVAMEEQPCLLFIDEIDGVCKNRSLPNLADHTMTLTTTFLTSFNDLIKKGDKKASVIFVGATNYPSRVDSAMLNRVELIRLPLPDDKARAESFKMKLQSIAQLSDDLSWEDMAEATEGYDQRDISHIVSHIKKLIRQEIMKQYKTASDAVAALENGSFRLDRNLFDWAMELYTPSSKDDMERQLNEFETSRRSS